MIRLTRIVCTAALVAVVATSCSGASGPPLAPSTGGTSELIANPSSPPSDTVEDLDSEFAPLVDSTLRVMAVPGAVVRVETPEGNWERAFGSRVAGAYDPMTVDTHFRIGSITKTMVGTVLLQLVREKMLRLDDPVSKYRPDLPGGSSILVSQLLDMRSGLFSYTESWTFNQTLDDNPQSVWDPEDLVSIAEDHEPYFAPDTGFRYTNTNTVLAALIIETITGQSIEKLLQERIFAPLGLTATSFPGPEDNSIPTPFAHGYLFGTNVSALSSVTLTTAQATAARDGLLLPTDVTDLNPSWIWAAGGAISTAADVAAYARQLVSSTDLIGEDLQRQRLAGVEPRASDPSAVRYGLGVESFGPMIGHDGAIPGYQSFMGHDPDHGITVVVLCNVRDGATGMRPANEIAYNIVRSLYAGMKPN